MSRTREVLYGDPVNILNTKGMLPVFAAPIFNIGAQAQAVIRPASTRNLVTAQAGRIAVRGVQLPGPQSGLPLYSGLQRLTPVASAVNRGSPFREDRGRRHQVLPPRPALYLRHRAALKPDSGDLYGSAQVNLNNLAVPTTPLTLAGSSTSLILT